jgi:hypothetical protein
MPPYWRQSKEIERRFNYFRLCYKRIMVCRHCRTNLLPFHRSALQTLQASTETIVVQCDKNLGPACIDIPSNITLAFRDHLNDEASYGYLTPNEAQSHGDLIRKPLKRWIEQWKTKLNQHELWFIRSALKDPEMDHISTFYLLMKIHKSPLMTSFLSKHRG